MKVKVNVKTSPKAQEKYYEQAIAEAYAEMETMFQENKDLRVSEAHLRDDLACAEALIAELNNQITASETDVTYWKAKAEEATAELVKYDVGHYQREIDELQETVNLLGEKCQKFQDERDKAWAALRGLQNIESELEYYRDIAAHRKERNEKLMEQIRELETELAELTEDYDALVQTKREYGEYIDTLRQENKRLRNQMPLPEFMRQFIEMTREAVQNEFPDSGNS